nr:type II toxin-antitoxin system VapC family toxin [Thioalkalivibrio sp.]
MGSVKVLFDTNILIDYLNGIDAAREEIAAYPHPMISTITWVEVMVGSQIDEEVAVRQFLDRFLQVQLDATVAERAVSIRRQIRIRLPDAIIWASAQMEDALLVTRNSRDFPRLAPDVRIPYSL